jgi:large subunit ribosomal protein L4
MATLDVVTMDNKKAGTLDLSPAVFEARVRPHLFQAEVRRQLSRRQRGTHSSKNRSAVSGGGSKPWRQKGTGRARQGTNRAPQWSGGGVVFGPVPRSHEHALPKKVRREALRGALSHRLGEGAVTVLEAIELQQYRAKRVLEVLEALGLAGESVLIVIDEPNAVLEKSAANLKGVSVIRVAGLNVYDVLRHSKLLLTRAAVAGIERRLAATREGEQA